MSDKSISPFAVEIATWTLLCLGLAIGVGIETDWSRRMIWPIVTNENLTPATFDKPPLSDPFSLPAADKYLEIAMRPLFVITRRPAPDRPQQEPPKPQMQKGQFVLTGTMLVGPTKFAQLLEKAGNKSRIVAEGKEINGVMIKQIMDNQVVMSQHGDTEILVLQTAKAAPANSPPPPAVKPPITPPGPPPIRKP